MTDFMQYEKGCSPCAIQRKYGLTYVQGYELAERLKKTQELAEENTKLKSLLKECYNLFAQEQCSDCGLSMSGLIEICTKIEEVLGEKE